MPDLPFVKAGDTYRDKLTVQTFNCLIDATNWTNQHRMNGGAQPLASRPSRFWAMIVDVVDGNLADNVEPHLTVHRMVPFHNRKDSASEKDVDVKWEFLVNTPNWHENGAGSSGEGDNPDDLSAYPSPLLWPFLACPKDDGDFDYTDEDYKGKCPLSCFYRTGQVVEIAAANDALVVVTVPPMYQ